MTPASLKAWRERMGWTKARAASALELSPNGYAALEAGFAKGPLTGKDLPRPIRRHIELACLALENYGSINFRYFKD
jgi:DNA-binding XRE family transcriptional regulator